MIIVYIIGPAGSGKTTLTKSLVEYIQHYNSEISVITLNLDPAVQTLPYAPDIDIQDYITVDEVIKETNLGPNGAIIAATDQMINYLADIKYELNQYNDPEILLVDTPGQMELWAFRNTGAIIANALGFEDSRRLILFCFDSNLSKTPTGLISTLLLATSVQYRFPNTPQLNLLTKIDLLDEEALDNIQKWIEDDYALHEAIADTDDTMLGQMSRILARTFRDFGSILDLIPTAPPYNQGLDEVFGAIQRAVNDDTSPYY